jgi:hypothetical protein
MNRRAADAREGLNAAIEAGFEKTRIQAFFRIGWD